MKSRKNILIAVVALLLMALTTSGWALAETGHSAVRLPADAAIQITNLGLNPSSALDYGSFLWLELSEAEASRLEVTELPGELHTDAYTLRLGEQSFDPLVAAPVLPAGWDSVEYGGSDLHLVQVKGPCRAEWIESLEDSGLQIVQYIHPFTYVVWGDPITRGSVEGADMVRWTGAFAPAYRVLPKWRNLPEVPQRVKVLMYRGADTDAVVREIEGLGAVIERRKALNHIFEIAGFAMPGNALQTAAQIPGVYSIQLVPTDGGLRGEMSDQVNVNNVDGTNLAFPGYMSWLSGVGVDGTGVIMANVDGGVQNDHPDLINRLISCSGTTCGGGATSSHGTHTAGIMAADGTSGTLDSYGFLRGLGVAPGADLVEQVYSPYYTYTDGMLMLMTDSYNNGASLSSNSWGPAGSPQGYDDDTMQVDIGVRDADPDTPGNQPLSYMLSIMNGNGGTSSQGSPDEAKNIFTIGSTKMQNSNGSQILQIDDISSNSAHGPCLDGRKIPHMVAPGCYVDSTTSGSTYTTMCGTSMSSPHVSGAAALFIEYYRGLPGYVSDPSPALIKAAFLPVAHDLAGHLDADGGILGHPFDSKQGWGRMDLEAVVDPQVQVVYFDNPTVFDNTAEEWSQSLSAVDPSEPVRIMLVWTDAPGHGLGGSTPAWNNDLDLVVEYGTDTYRGNYFGSSGWSIDGGTADYMNNTEGVLIGPTASGAFTIRVQASDINSDGIPNQGDTTDQDFAVVCYNCSAADPTCDDGIQNQGEDRIDCGGPCPPCTCTADAQCDNGVFCDGAELCDAYGECQAGSDPCVGFVDCDEVNDVCIECYGDPDCDDGLFCTGVETCVGNACQAGSDPCPGLVCDEINDQCVAGPAVQYSWNMDTDPGWSTQGLWAWGQPTGGGGQYGNPDPTSGYTGSNVYGYNLSGDYENNLPETHLTSTAINCTGLSDVTLKFWRWLNVERSLYDRAYIRVSNNGSTWTTIFQNPDSHIQDSSWSQQEMDISAVADDQPTVYLRWTMGTTDSSWQFSGWNIDDIEIWAIGGGEPTCSDGIQNQGEDLIDCGGPCPPCTCLVNGDCADGVFCNGTETCDAYGECQAGSDPCPGQLCDETNDICVDCFGDGDCDDGLWCNGAETCVSGSCQAGTDPCPGQGCDEVNDECTPLPVLYTPSEYDDNEGMLIRWGTYTSILTDMTVAVTTGDPDAIVYIVVTGASQQSSATTTLSSAGADMDQVEFITYTTDTAWIRDYGPRFISNDSVREIVDHEYNRPRPNDDAFNTFLGSLWGETVSEIPLIHGGGNFHLFSNGEAYMSDLILDENPGLTEQDVKDLFLQYENLDLTIYPRFPSSFDATGHIDMWMLPLGDNKILIGEYSSSTGLPYTITESAVADFTANGYTVYRTPGWQFAGTHYTYTNAVVMNDLVLISSFGGSWTSEDAQALSVFQTAMPGHTIVQVDSSTIISAAGALHCIMMHVPEVAVCTVPGDCDDGLWCTGTEDCVSGSCVPGTPPDCSDGVACTDDSCNEGTDSCDNIANDANCDNGLFCDGAETCDALLDCQAGTAPNCNDGVGCTDDSCNEGTDSCDNIANDANCDNGLYCDGAEACHVTLDCQVGTAPDCNDGVACTDDSCNEGTDSCDNVANDANCDNGLFCDGAETCDALLGCQVGSDPCPGQLCDEVTDTCYDCEVNGDCDDGLFCNGPEQCVAGSCQPGTAPDCGDGVACTVDSCNEGTDSCDHIPNDAACDNGLYCDGVETCHATLGCQAGAAVDCDDGVTCTADSCNEGTDSCDNVPDDGACADALFCNGAEVCDPVLDCEAGSDPCPGQMCDEGTDMCVDCLTSGDCDDGLYCNGAETCVGGVCQAGTAVDCSDGVACTVDSCNEGTDSCDNVPNDAACANGLYCDGVETCDALLGCQAGTAVDCNDGVGCTVDSCNETTDSCDNIPDDAACADALFCNGAEVCDPALDCQAGGDPCPGQLCDEANDVCVDCLGDPDCDDGLFCNGAETCVGGNCQAGSDPCPGLQCDEVNDVCIDCALRGEPCEVDADCCSYRCHHVKLVCK